MHGELKSVYQAMANHRLNDVRTLLIVVDWSDRTRSQQLIRAAVALDGRSHTVYEEVHPITSATKPCVHTAFLEQLKLVLPVGCQPIIVTDAGFRSPWFRAVEKLGWHWVRRIRNRNMVRTHVVPAPSVVSDVAGTIVFVDSISSTAASTDHAAGWCGAKTLYTRATATALDLGLMDHVRNCPITYRMVIIKRTPKGRQMKTAHGERTQSSHRAKQAIAQLEPWLLASSCSLSYLSAEAVVSVYAPRMQIEEAFRDTKNVRMGLGLSASGSRGGKRLAVLALIACLAEFVLRLIGQTAIGKSLQYDLQLTNRRSRPELSCLQVGRLLLQKTLATFTKAEFDNTIKRWRMPHHALQI